ncbi:MAG: deoxyribonuclease IV [Lentisphaerae bacterium]|nr:deoxyribonuclease IV [Lentisphaerota bacterium]
MKYFGAHVSASGGVYNAPLNAAAINADTFALFTKNQRQWSAPPLKEEDIALFKENCLKNNFDLAMILPHDSYLINLGQPDSTKAAAAHKAFAEEMKRCEALGLHRLNFHPGSHLKLMEMDECLKRIAEGIMSALSESCGVMAVIENTAGQGSNVGFELEQIARIIDYCHGSELVKVCVDTCHSFAAGYDLKSESGYAAFWQKFDSLIGFDRLGGIHLNDAKAPCGSKLDRHESLGAGTLGWEVFERIARDKNLDNIPIILETPDPDLWASEIAQLKKYAATV